MKWLRRGVAGLLVALVLAASLSWTFATTLVITDESGAPASDAYVRYHYEGNLLNFVHPITYVARASAIVRPDAEGRVQIPFRIHFRPPLSFSSPPSLVIDNVFVPRLHNAFGPIGRWATSREGVFSWDEQRNHVTVFDVSGTPALWERSLGELFDCIRDTLSPHGSGAAASQADVRTISHARDLIAYVRREYAAFLERYAETPRPREIAPAWGPPFNQQETQKRIDEQLARDPLWGPHVESLWRYRLKELEALEASVK
jgi:hypothetical protein